MEENPLQIAGIDTPSPFEMAPSALKQPFRLSELSSFADPFGGFDEQRAVEVGASEALLPTDPHPWHVKSNGDDTISVGYGSVYSYDGSSLTLREFKRFEGFDVEGYSPITVTGAGSIYARIGGTLASFPDIRAGGTDSNGDTFDVDIYRVEVDSSDSFLFSFETTAPSSGSYFYFELAKVELDGGVAVVTRQIIRDHPTLNSWLEGP